MINHTSSAFRSLFNFMGFVGQINQINKSNVSGLLPISSSLSKYKQAAEMSDIIVATYMFGPEVGVMYFNKIFDNLTNLLAQYIAHKTDPSSMIELQAQIEELFPYYSEKYFEDSATTDNLFNLLKYIGTQYATLLQHFSDKISTTAFVITKNMVNISGTYAVLPSTPFTISSSITDASTAFTAQYAFLNIFNLVSNPMALNDIVASVSGLLKGIATLDKQLILMNAQELDDIDSNLQALTGTAVDNDFLCAALELRDRSEDVAWYVQYVKPQDSVTKTIYSNNPVRNHRLHVEYRQDGSWWDGFYKFMMLLFGIINVILLFGLLQTIGSIKPAGPISIPPNLPAVTQVPTPNPVPQRPVQQIPIPPTPRPSLKPEEPPIKPTQGANPVQAFSASPAQNSAPKLRKQSITRTPQP